MSAQYAFRGRDRSGARRVGVLELEPLELEALVRRRHRAGWQELEVIACPGGPGEQVVGRIAPKRPRGRLWWVQVPLGLGQQRLEL